MRRKPLFVAAALGMALFSPAAMASDKDGDQFFREVGEGLKATVERPDLEFAAREMREQEARERADREAARRERAEQEQAARDANQREENARRAQNPNGPF